VEPGSEFIDPGGALESMLEKVASKIAEQRQHL